MAQQFSAVHMIDPMLRASVTPPRYYAEVCTRKGTQYYEYGEFPVEGNLSPNQFKLRHFVGKGTFARCYASTFTESPNDTPLLCIKVLKRTKEKHLVKLRRELSILTKLQGCPGVINFHGVVKDPDCKMWSLIQGEFEKVEKEDYEMLKQLRGQGGGNGNDRHRVALVFDLVYDVSWKAALNTITNETLAYLLFQILVTLECAHSQGIMHRDIKPPNCLLDLKNERVVVVDWGQAEYFVPFFKHNVQVGGRSFKAPELVYGGNVVRGLHDYACDVWAFGVMMASLIYFGATKNLFWASDREGVIQSISRLLGTRDLVCYLRERPYIEMSELTHDLCSMSRTERDTPFEQSEVVTSLLEGAEERIFWERRQTPEALDLIDQILKYNPAERPTCREMMMTHPYFECVRQRLFQENGIVFDSSDPASPINDEALKGIARVFTTTPANIPGQN